MFSGGILRVIQFWCLNQIIIWLNPLVVPQTLPPPPMLSSFQPVHPASPRSFLCQTLQVQPPPLRLFFQGWVEGLGWGMRADSGFINLFLWSQMCFWTWVPFACYLKEAYVETGKSAFFLESNWSLMIFLNMINEFLAKPEIIMIRKNTDPWEEFTPCMRT